MDDTDYIRGRMNALLNERIAHGANLEGYGEGRTRRRRRDSKCDYYKRKKPKYWLTKGKKCIKYQTHLKNYRRRRAAKGEGLLLDEYDYATPYGGMRCGGCGCCSQCGYGQGVLVGGSTRRRRRDSKCRIYEKKNPKYWLTPQNKCISYASHLKGYRTERELKKPKNSWLAFLAKFRKSYKAELEGLPPQEVMKYASEAYRRLATTAPRVRRPRVRPQMVMNPVNPYAAYSMN